MARTRDDMILIVEDNIQDVAGKISETSIITSLEEGVQVYSIANAKRKVEEYDGDDSTYEFDLPTGWDQNHSVVLEVEYPTGNRDRSLIDDNDWEIYSTATDTWLFKLNSHTPATGEKCRLFWADVYELTDSTNELPSTLAENSVINAATAFIFEKLQAYYAQGKSNVTTADVVDQLSKAEQCRNLAELFKRKSGLKTYIDNFEVGDIALEFIDVDPPPSYEGELGWMTHGKRTR